MSSTTPTSTFHQPDLQTATPDPSSTVTISTGNGGPGTSSSLYLYTFLVTLALLLSISAAIIARSYVLRRRLRALVAAGVLPPEALVNTPRRHGGTGGRGLGAEVGRRPGMFEVWLADEGAKGVQEDGGWEEKAAPLSLASLAALRAAQPHPSPSPAVLEQRQPSRPPRRPNFAVPFFSRRDPYAPAPPAPAPSPRLASSSPRAPHAEPTSTSSRWRPFARTGKPAPVTADTGTEMRDTNLSDSDKEDMQLALLIAMPVEQGQGRGAGEVPVLEIGVRVVGARVPARGADYVGGPGKGGV
ncbi:unnamed protein product [Peniophora sp. CBMAI 1063]|nr:unnamed protein product [Peniophora sp. CBMAI 1063]